MRRVLIYFVLSFATKLAGISARKKKLKENEAKAIAERKKRINDQRKNLCLFFCLFVAVASIDCNVKEEVNIESKIKYKLFCNGYDSTQRPVIDHKTITTVKVKMMIKSYDYVSTCNFSFPLAHSFIHSRPFKTVC